jgi:hypothetical protein
MTARDAGARPRAAIDLGTIVSIPLGLIAGDGRIEASHAARLREDLQVVGLSSPSSSHRRSISP